MSETTTPTPNDTRALAEALCLADDSWEHHDATDGFPCSACTRKANAAATDDTPGGDK